MRGHKPSTKPISKFLLKFCILSVFAFKCLLSTVEQTKDRRGSWSNKTETFFRLIGMSERNFCQWQQHGISRYWQLKREIPLRRRRCWSKDPCIISSPSFVYQVPMKYCCHHFPPRYSLMREIWGSLTASVPLPISQSLCKAAQWKFHANWFCCDKM